MEDNDSFSPVLYIINNISFNNTYWKKLTIVISNNNFKTHSKLKTTMDDHASFQ